MTMDGLGDGTRRRNRVAQMFEQHAGYLAGRPNSQRLVEKHYDFNSLQFQRAQLDRKSVV
jgi:hypothetical protein